MANDVTFQHPGFAEFEKRALLVDDVCESRVKAKGDAYLPRPNPGDTSSENKKRFAQYLLRAMFFNATGHTRRGLVGAAFIKSPVLIVPGTMNYVEADIDGEGNGIDQQSRSVLAQVLGKGRHGLLVDYPQTNKTLTRADMAINGVRATILSIDATRITNWKVQRRGSRYYLSLLVYKDDESASTSDGFGSETAAGYRVLRLTDGIYSQEFWQQDADTVWQKKQEFTPLQGNGQPWHEIPFTFVGSENNDTRVDMAPLYDMAVINIGHYRNSADYEDSVFTCGQPQPWASGVTPELYAQMQEAGVYIGSRELIALPENGQFGFAQAQPNTMVKDAMEAKEHQMIALGARTMQSGGVAKTATQANDDSESQHSPLSLAVSNVSQAYSQCLAWVSIYMAAASGGIVYKISQEFTTPNLDAQSLTALFGAWQSGQYPESDLWTQLRRHGLIDPSKTDEAIREELDTTAPAGLDLGDADAD